ncbi:MAG: hypothetical protein WCD37_10160 [Chloroflexia bacterium]
MIKRFVPLLIAIGLVLALAACDMGTPPTATPVAPAITPTTFMLETSGTIAGIRQTLTIAESRAASFKDGSNPEKTFTVDEKQYSALVTQVAKADFFNLQDSYDSGTVSDDKYYALTVTQGSQSKTVMVAEIGGKDITPQALRDLITLLVNIQTGGANS